MDSQALCSSVDVVIPNWNGARCVGHCLESLTAQTYPNFRVLVIDNGSTDDSLRVVRERFPQVLVIEIGVNSGFAAAVNRGIRESTGDYVALLNNDAVADPEWIAKLAQALDADPALGSCASRMLVMNKPWLLNVAGLAYSPSLRACSAAIGWGSPDSYEHHFPYLITAPSGGAAMYRRSALDEVGLFDDDYFLYYEDFDMGLRLQLGGYDCLYVPDAVVYHDDEAIDRQHPDWIVKLNHRNSRWTALKCFPKSLVAYLALRDRCSLRVAFSEQDEHLGPGAPQEALVPPSKTLAEKREEIRSRTKIPTDQFMNVLCRPRRPYQCRSADSRKFSVALFSHSSGIAGTEICMLRFAKSLRAANLHPIVLLPSKPGVLIEELRKAKIEFSTVADAWWCMRPATSFLDRWIPVARSLRVGWQVSHLLRNSGVKAVGTTTSVVPAGAIAAFLAGVRHVWHVREIYPSDVLRPTLGMAATTMLIKLLSDAIVVPSQKVAALFPNATKVQVIPEGIDDRFFDALKASKSEARQLLSIPGDSRVLTIVATIDPSKELLQAIRVLKNLVARGKDVSLVLCGACFLPDYKQKLEDEARALAVGERVHFTGFTQDVTPVYDASDVLLITSHRESFGLTVVEAMARGLPVVATRCGGPEETISDGETGFLVDIADVQTMADRAAILLDGGAAVSAMIERARTLATRFRSAENFARTLQCYGLRQGDP